MKMTLFHNNFTLTKSIQETLCGVAAGFIVLTAVIFSGKADANELPPSTHEYKSVFESYAQWEWLDTEDWREANEDVGEIGGWRYYAREPEKGVEEN